MTRTHAFYGTAVLALSGVLAGSNGPGAAIAAESMRCSLVFFPTGRSAGDTYFIGTARSDTMLAGPGTLHPTGLGGHAGDGRPRPVYGQLVRIDTVAGGHADDVRRALGRFSERDVLLVPWDYDPGCETTYWNRSARWVEPGLVSFYEARLRPDSLWVGGRPTLDVFYGSTKPYPHNPSFRADYGYTEEERSRASLTVHERFTFQEVLPVYEHGPSSTPDSLRDQPLRRWVAANPELAKRYPADRAIAAVLRQRSR